MGFWKETGILNNNASDEECYERGYLLVKAEGAILEKPFKFKTVSNEMYQETAGFFCFYTTRSKTIYTPFYWLNFCRGARVKFVDGQELVIKDIIEVQDAKKAMSDGKGLKGLQIVF